MPNASAVFPASFPSAPARRPDPGTPAARRTFADALTFAYDLAYRAPGSLSLALRSAYGLRSADVVGRAERGNARPNPPPNASDRSKTYVARRAQLGARSKTDVARRAQLGEGVALDVVGRAELGNARPHPQPNVSDVARRAQLGDSSRPPRPYATFNVRADDLDIRIVAVRGRTFAGVRPWIR